MLFKLGFWVLTYIVDFGLLLVCIYLLLYCIIWFRGALDLFIVFTVTLLAYLIRYRLGYFVCFARLIAC